MRWGVRAVMAAALLSCAGPRALADADTHWLTDVKSSCAVFDANAKPGDSVTWSGGCAEGYASGKGTAAFTSSGKLFESFTGTFARGIAQDGAVSVSWGDGWLYDGEEADGQFSGHGVLINQAKDRFEGIWSGGKMNGQGTLTRANGEKYDGAWKDDQPNGPGTLTRADGSVVKGIFVDGVLQDAVNKTPPIAKADVKQEIKKDAPAVSAFANISGKTLMSVDGSQIALTLIEGGIERQITNLGSLPKKTTFTFMNDRLGTVVEDGGDAAGANVTGFFRLTGDGVEVRYADGQGELLIATPDGGVAQRRTGMTGETSCRSWYPSGHGFSESDKKQALAEYASRLGLGPQPKGGCETSPAQAALHPADIKPRERGPQAKFASLPVKAPPPGKIASLMPMTMKVMNVKESVVHAIDEGADAAAAPPVVMTALPTQHVPGQRDATQCLKVESDGTHWGFRNACGYPVQFAYCMWQGSETLAACAGEGDAVHAVSGSVAANSLATLTSDTRFNEKSGDHDFRWLACDGGAGEVIAHLDRADPPSGRCERAAIAINQR